MLHTQKCNAISSSTLIVALTKWYCQREFNSNDRNTTKPFACQHSRCFNYQSLLLLWFLAHLYRINGAFEMMSSALCRQSFWHHSFIRRRLGGAPLSFLQKRWQSKTSPWIFDDVSRDIPNHLYCCKYCLYWCLQKGKLSNQNAAIVRVSRGIFCLQRVGSVCVFFPRNGLKPLFFAQYDWWRGLKLLNNGLKALSSC